MFVASESPRAIPKLVYPLIRGDRLSWTGLLGTAMSLALLVLSAARQDGFALVATLLLSFLSTIIGIGSMWKLKLMERRSYREVPEDRIVIKYPNGSFRIIKSDEFTARELYWHPERCDYAFSERVYRLISLIGTFMLMMGVICLGNSTLPLQVAFAAAYLILNAVYWVVAALPPQWHWDLSCYKVDSEPYEGGEEKWKFYAGFVEGYRHHPASGVGTQRADRSLW